MRIDGKDVPVAAGDHVHTPLDVAHGIGNTHREEHLKVFLTFITRTSGA
jgi:quercetin dioxygenase-like cupin family protein